MTVFIAICLGLMGPSIGKSSLVAKDVIRAGDEVTLSNTTSEEGVFTPEDEEMIGREVRRTVYAGQTIKVTNTRSPRLVERNQIVTVKYIKGALEIAVTGRAMGDAGANEAVGVMNLQSRELIRGTVTEAGWILAQ